MLAFDRSVTFREGQDLDVALRNFWPPEGLWAWSSGKWAEINFAFDFRSRPPDGLAELIIDLDVFKYKDKHPGQNVLIYLNGLRVGSLYCTRRAAVVFTFNARILSRDDNVLTLDTPDAARPSEFGSADQRMLGVQLFSAQIRMVD